MIGIEWEVASSLTTTAGTLNFNTFPGLILDPSQCQATKDIRPPKTPVPGGDGDLIHRRFQTGYVYDLVVKAFETDSLPSCTSDARLLFENLALHLYAMLNDAGRYCWTPTGYGDNRALDDARWFSGVKVTLTTGGIWQAEFQIDSPFPYVIDLTQTSPTIVGSGPLTNSGNTAFYPVIKVLGPVGAAHGQGGGFNGFSVINDTLLQGIIYDAGRPGAIGWDVGSYAEIDTYKGTIFLNGDGADLSAGIDPTLTNLENPLALVPGVNNMEANGADATFLLNNAWA